jgi:hypothetical protein
MLLATPIPTSVADTHDHQRLAFHHSSKSSSQDSTQEKSWVHVLLFGWQWLRLGKAYSNPFNRDLV